MWKLRQRNRPLHCELMLGFALSAGFLAVPAWANAGAAVQTSAAAGCGGFPSQYSVVTDAAVLGGAPRAPRSRIVVFQPGESISPETQIFRVGVDGHWSGALEDYSWQLFSVAPGTHNVCVEWQSPVKRLASETAVAQVVTEAGKTAYLELTVAGSAGAVSSFYLFGVSAGEGNAVAGSLPHAVSLRVTKPPSLLR